MGLSASDVRDRQMKSGDMQTFPAELNVMIKIIVSNFNINHKYYVYTVNKIYDDPDVIAKLQTNDNLEEVSNFNFLILCCLILMSLC